MHSLPHAKNALPFKETPRATQNASALGVKPPYYNGQTNTEPSTKNGAGQWEHLPASMRI